MRNRKDHQADRQTFGRVHAFVQMERTEAFFARRRLSMLVVPRAVYASLLRYQKTCERLAFGPMSRRGPDRVLVEGIHVIPGKSYLAPWADGVERERSLTSEGSRS